MATAVTSFNNQESGVFDNNVLSGLILAVPRESSKRVDPQELSLEQFKEILVGFISGADRSYRYGNIELGTMNYTIREHHLKEPARLISSLLVHIATGSSVTVFLHKESIAAEILSFADKLEKAAGPKGGSVRVSPVYPVTEQTQSYSDWLAKRGAKLSF